MIRLLLVDNYTSIRQPLAFLLTLQPDMEIVGDVGSTAEALRLAARTNVDLLLLDTELPQDDGVKLISTLRAEHPQLKVLVLTGTTDAYHHAYAVAAGAAAVLHRSVSFDKVLHTIRQIASGEGVMPSGEAVAMHTLRWL